MASRLALHNQLCEVLGSRNVYFQPPESVKLVYPCIVYGRAQMDTKYADDSVYNSTNSYEITIIDKNPDSKIRDRLIFEFSMIRHMQSFVNDNLNHDVFRLFY